MILVTKEEENVAIKPEVALLLKIKDKKIGFWAS